MLGRTEIREKLKIGIWQKRIGEQKQIMPIIPLFLHILPVCLRFTILVCCLECSCPTGWDKHTRTDGKTYCYRYFEDLKYWTDARRHCMEFSNVDVNGCKLHQADLASIDSLNTNTYLLGLEKKTPGSRKELCQRNFNQILVL